MNLTKPRALHLLAIVVLATLAVALQPGITSIAATQADHELTAPEAGMARAQIPGLLPEFPEGAEIPSGDPVPLHFDPQELQDWSPTKNPNSVVISGEVRSDSESIPGGFTKTEADLAETKEALLNSKTAAFRATAQTSCQVYWPSPFEVCGAIRDFHNSIGGPQSFLTFPQSNELANADGIEKRPKFLNGYIFWHPEHGAHAVTSDILLQWAYSGGPLGDFGYPTGDPTDSGDSDGWKRQPFISGSLYGARPDTVFPAYSPDSNSSRSYANRALSITQKIGIAGGNDYTDAVVLETRDSSGNPVILRRGWYNDTPEGSPWGYGKIYHKHGIYNLNSIRALFEGNSPVRFEKNDAMYETPIYRMICQAGICRTTSEWFIPRGVVEPTVWIDNAIEPRGVNTLYPLFDKGTHGSSVRAPEWFNLDLYKGLAP